MSQAYEEWRTEMKLTDAFEAPNRPVRAFAPFVIEDGKPGAERARLPGRAHQVSSPDALSRPDLATGADNAVLEVRPAADRHARQEGLSGTCGL